MKKYLPILFILFLFTACKKETTRTVATPQTEILIKTTPVKDQGKSDLCWLYAMLATIESEHLMMGDSVNLSPGSLSRYYLMDQALRRLIIRNQRPASMAIQSLPAITTRGMAGMTLSLLQQYGITHWDAYHPDINMKVLARKVEKTVDNNRNASHIKLFKNMKDMMDEAMRPLPQYVFLLGAEYTPQEFARSVCRPDEYVALTSFAHHPYGETFALEVPDNYYQDRFLNLDPDTLMAHIDHALQTGHPVCWEGDISEDGFNWPMGIARLERATERSILSGTPLKNARQQDFEEGKTTDDHSMELIGIARSPRGRRYYIAKNSWGTENAYKGLMYLSENYIRLKTIAVWMSQDAFSM
jgi:bleomycin hydrolase